MLILCDISGIQDFLFDVRETGGKQAASLRFRSLRLQLIVECIARRVLWALDLPEDKHLLFCAAGKFAIEVPDNHETAGLLRRISADIDRWLLDDSHGRLKCSLITDSTIGNASQRNDAANVALQRRKLKPWAIRPWSDDALTIRSTFYRDEESQRDADLGRRLLDTNIRTIELADQPSDDVHAFAGVSVRFKTEPRAEPSRGRSSLPLDRVARHTPRHADRSLVEFVELADRSRGAAMLGVLKADADNLGAAIRTALGHSTDFTPLKALSQKLDTFFGTKLNAEMSATKSKWNNIYTVFAGGDDLLMVGPWDVIIDFADHARTLFMKEFNPTSKPGGLTISAGCAIVKPKFPIHLSAQQAEELLERAKTGTKDQFALLGEIWRWSDHAKIIDAGKHLADWVDAGDIQRGWLHTLLELALLRRGQSPGRDANLIPAMATSRLSYHVARNWPKTSAPGEKGAARQWIDTVLRHFDTYEKTTDPIAKHLPAILRYAMLASRSKGEDQ
jgi:CRISPR-associated protein Csm1